MYRDIIRSGLFLLCIILFACSREDVINTSSQPQATVCFSLGAFETQGQVNSISNKLQQLGAYTEIRQARYRNQEGYWIDIDVPKSKTQVINAIEKISKGLTVIELLPRQCS